MSISDDTLQQTPPPTDDLPEGGRPERLEKRRRRRNSPFKRVQRVIARLRLRRQLPKVLVVVSVALLAIGVGALVVVTDAVSRVQNSFNRLEQVIRTTGGIAGTDLTLEDFTILRSSLRNVITTLSSVQRTSNVVRPLLNLNTELETTLLYQDAVLELAQAADSMTSGLEPMLFFLVGGNQSSTVTAQISAGERVVELLRLGRPSFLNADNHLNAARVGLDRIDRNLLSATTLLQLEQLETYHEQLSSIQSLLMVSPDLLTVALGLESPVTYLVLSQNSDELRPSGGFLSTYGWLNVRNGRVDDYNYSATSANNPNPPPAAFATELDIPSWWLQYEQPIYAAWDGSWTPNFPETAERAMWFYNSGNNPQSPVSGVIAIDIVAFEYILQGLGQVRVTDGDRTATVTPDNFRNVVYDIRASGEGDAPHKRFLAATFRQIFADWQTTASDPDRSAAILGALLQALREKHIMLYFEDERLNDALDLLGWSGRQLDGLGRDYLAVVDANLGNKSNSSIRRQITYDVEINADHSANSRLTVNYDYPESVAANDPAVNAEFHGQLVYNNLLQVYTPVNSALVSSSGAFLNLERVDLPAHTLFTSFVIVPFDGTERFQFVYSTPDVVEVVGGYERYNLLIQKQPGMRVELVNVQVSLPEGAQLVSTIPQAAASYSIERQILEFRFDLISDVVIEIVYQVE